MAEDTGVTTPAGAAGTAGDQRAAGGGRVATGRFAAARGEGGGRGGAAPAAAGRSHLRTAEESERERQARVAHALKVAEGDEEATGGDTDWRAVGFFGAGLAIGTLLGAGVALLLAPASGFETRMRLLRSARRTRDRLSGGARRRSRDLQRNVSRQLTRGRWAAEDAIERRRRG